MKRLVFLLAFVLMGSSLPTLKYRALDNSGVPMSGAKLYFYTHGTTTPKNTYSDEALSTANANPVVADSHGWFGEIYLNTDDKYKVVLKSSAGITIWTVDDIAAAQITDSALATRMLQIASSPLDYGAAGDGSTDDSTAVQAAINGSVGVVDLLGKTYRVDTGLTLKSGLTLRNGTLDFSASNDDIYLSATGTVGSAILLNANATAGDTSIELVAVTGLAVGDLLWLTSTASYGAATGTDGEICRIVFIDGMDVYLAAPLNGSYTTLTTASVKEITPKRDIIIDDVSVTANSSAAGTGVLFSCTYCDRTVIRSSTFTGIKTAGARFTTSTLVNIQASSFSSTYGIAGAIGVDLLDGVNGVSISGGTAFNSLVKGVALGLDGASRKGVTRSVDIASSVFENCSTAAVYSGILAQHLSVSGSIIRAQNPADGLNLTSVSDVRVLGTTFVGGDYGIDDTTVTSLLTASNYFTGQTTGSVKGSAAAVLVVEGSSGNQAGVSGTGYGSGAGLVGLGGDTDGPGVSGTGAGNGRGVSGTGAGTGSGVYGVGAAGTNSTGVEGVGATTNGVGVSGTGKGTGAGVVGTGSTTAGSYGVKGVASGAVNGGVYGSAKGTGIGVEGVGDAAGNGVGVAGTGTGTAPGILATSSTNAASYALKALAAGSDNTAIYAEGGVDSEASIYGTCTAGGACVGVMGNSSGGGVVGISSAGYGVTAQGDTTSPVTAAFRIVAQDAAPTDCQIGDMYVTSAGVLYISTNASSSPCTGWTKVGAQ